MFQCNEVKSTEAVVLSFLVVDKICSSLGISVNMYAVPGGPPGNRIEVSASVFEFQI